MPLPNSDIASAFIESYITIRKSAWGLDLNDHENKVRIPADSTIRHKLDICIKMLQSFKTAKTFDDWIKILDDLYTKEKAELEAQNNRFFVARMITNDPLIADVLHGIRTYLISELKSEDQFKKLKDENTRRKIELEKQILWDKEHNAAKDTICAKQKQLDEVNKTLDTRDDNDLFYIDLFANTLAMKDTEAKRLDEKTFEHFKANIEKKHRLLVVCQRLLDDHESKKVELPPIQPIESTESTPAPAAVVAAPVQTSNTDSSTQAIQPTSPKARKQDKPIVIELDLDQTPPAVQQERRSPQPHEAREPAAGFEQTMFSRPRRNPPRRKEPSGDDNQYTKKYR